MRKITLDLRKAYDRETLHEAIAEALDFPPYYGANLDALYDLLSEVSTDTCILVMFPLSIVLTEEEFAALNDDTEEDPYSWEEEEEEDFEDWEEDYPEYLDRLRATFADAEEENPHLCVFLL